MALVAYSDESSEDEGSETVSGTQKSEEHKQKSTLKLLPKPKAKVNPSFNDFVLGLNLKGSVQISIPDIPDYEEEYSEEEQERKKRLKIQKSTTGSGLLSLLPTPGVSRNEEEKKALFLIPKSVSKPPPKPIPPKVVKKPIVNAVVDDDDDDDIDGKADFFSFTSDTTKKPAVLTATETEDHLITAKAKETDSLPLNVDIAPTMPEEAVANSSFHGPVYEPSSSVNKEPFDINDPAYKRLIAKKFGEEPPEAINIIDINASRFLSTNREYIKTISQEQPEEFKGVVPSSTAKRKHQITYLAYQAKQRELQLKNEWATNKVTKKQTRAKYGF